MELQKLAPEKIIFENQRVRFWNDAHFVDIFGAVLLGFLVSASSTVTATNFQDNVPEDAIQEEIKRHPPEYLSICNKTNVPVLHYRFRGEQYYLDKATCKRHPSLNKLNKITFFNPRHRVGYNLVYQHGMIHTFAKTSSGFFDLHAE